MVMIRSLIKAMSPTCHALRFELSHVGRAYTFTRFNADVWQTIWLQSSRHTSRYFVGLYIDLVLSKGLEDYLVALEISKPCVDGRVPCLQLSHRSLFSRCVPEVDQLLDSATDISRRARVLRLEACFRDSAPLLLESVYSLDGIRRVLSNLDITTSTDVCGYRAGMAALEWLEGSNS